MEDRLARQRHDDQLAQTRRSQEELLKMQEDSIAKQESMRKGKVTASDSCFHFEANLNLI